MLLALILVVFGCGDSSEDTGESRNVGGSDTGSGQNMGSGDTGQGTAPILETCADGAPLIAASDWSQFLPAPATSVEAVWNGEHYGVLWLASEASSGIRPLKFVRVGRDGTMLGDVVTVGQASTASHRLVFTGERYIVAWVNGRAGDDAYDGIRVAVVSREGALAESMQDVADTFDSVQLDLEWDDFAGGLLAYTKGGLGERGLYVTTINMDASLNDEKTVDERPTTAFSAIYGDGAWAVAYGLRDAALEDPVLLHLLDEEGDTYDPAPVELSNGAMGRIHIAFSRGNYAIAWTGINVEGKVQPATILLDGAAEVIGEPVIAIAADFGIVEDLAAVPAKGFILSWHGEIEGQPMLAVQSMSALGILEDPMVLRGGANGQLSQSRLVQNAESRLQLFCSVDADPQPLGYSTDVSVASISIQLCE